MSTSAEAAGEVDTPTWLQKPWPRALMRALPFLSMAVGIVGAFVMNRGPERAPYAAGAGALLWLTLSVRTWLSARAHKAPGPGQAPVTRVLRVSSLVATQSLIQFCLFFALPFYFDAMARDIGHYLFMGLLALLAAGSLWDPLTERLLARPGVTLVLPACASCLALSAMLPGLGFNNLQALWTAAGAAAAGCFWTALLSPASAPLWRRLEFALIAALVAPTFLLLGGARLVPAAPMRLVTAAFGTARKGHWVAREHTRLLTPPDQLVCATALYAPLGVRETLYHVWYHDGERRQRIALDITGGRKRGYRTRSLARRLGRSPQGTWTCQVETAGGQLLGKTRLCIGERCR